MSATHSYEAALNLLRYFVAFHTPGDMPQEFSGGQMQERVKEAKVLLNTPPTGPLVPVELLEDCLEKIEAYSREVASRYCGGVPNNILLPQLREAITRLRATTRPIEQEKP